jgi:hypothetical protein
MTERDHEPIDVSDELSPAELSALADLLSDPAVWDEPDPALEDQVVAAIVAEAAGAGPARPEGTDAATETGDDRGLFSARPETGSARRITPGRRRGGGRSGYTLVLGAAAAAAAVVVVMAVVALRATPRGQTETLLALRPTPPAGAAEAEARIEERADGTRILLQVKGLAPAPPGTYYEAWLRKSPQVGVSAGTFHLRGGGTEQIELWSGVSPHDYPLVTVTLQQEGGGGDSSGKVYLSGRLG